MCKGAVAAPRPLQALVYPILQEKSLSFCEKIKKTEILNGFKKNAENFSAFFYAIYDFQHLLSAITKI
mgnify:CR=1 FL=1